ncbi:hypothetical protein [Acrocarpospora sp. B8E8]|uniref:hypothetical protein n=1 Tax=Acrocarpospora sp. B8E8 TaxID=3153572 RepID=UPI00325D13C3
MTALPFNITDKISKNAKRHGAYIAVMGEQSALQAACESGAPITLTGKLAGEVVYLGHAWHGYDEGTTREVMGLDHVIGESPRYPGVVVATYLVDMSRLEGAPTLLKLKRQTDADRMRAAVKLETRAEEEDDALDRLAEDGA